MRGSLHARRRRRPTTRLAHRIRGRSRFARAVLSYDQEIIALDTLFAQPLVGLNAENRDIPILVTRIPSRANGDVSADGTRIVYHLRHGVRFADGVELTSADVAFTYHALLIRRTARRRCSHTSESRRSRRPIATPSSCA